MLDYAEYLEWLATQPEPCENCGCEAEHSCEDCGWWFCDACWTEGHLCINAHTETVVTVDGSITLSYVDSITVKEPSI